MAIGQPSAESSAAHGAGAPAPQAPDAEASLLVLLGAPLLADGSPGPALRRRLDCALRLLRREPRARLLATGGVPPRAPCPCPEAEAVAEVLRGQGIPTERILLEPTARNTWENAAASARLLRALGLSGLPLRLVTDPWHLPRARLAFRAQGLHAHSAGCRVPAGSHPPGLPRLLLHELLGFGLYALRSMACALARRLRPRRC